MKINTHVLLVLLIGLLILFTISCLSPYEEHLKSGAIAISKDNYNEAIAEYTKLIEIAPRQATGYSWRGFCYYNIAQYDLAISDLTNAIIFQDKSLDQDYNFRGLSYFAKEDYDLAVLDFTKAIEIYPNPLYYDHIGLSLHKLEKFDLAIEDFTVAITLSPKDERLYSDRADSYIASGQITLAIMDLRKTVELSLSYDNSKLLQSARERLKRLGVTE